MIEKFKIAFADFLHSLHRFCLKLIEHLHELKDETKVSAWLITTTTRQCIRVKSLKHRETGADDEFEEPADPGENLEDLRIMTETQQTIRDAVEQLSGRCRDLIEMLYFDQRSLSYEEISQKMGMPVASIGPTRARCLDKLRTQLRRRG